MTTSYPLRLTNTLPLANSIDYGKWYRNYEELQSELSALLTHFSSIEELSEHQEDIIIHSDCDDMYDVARYYIEETGALGEVPASLQNYIDYQAYGRDLDLSGTFISTNHGIFEIVY